ncbi:uncharacterized protein N7482_002981 [Penicillium canariense]|uniref:ER transporter 6TM N-terminal domain-containing protein n=1 Tax=Penicillium canariense TaxID=189055 RepID=A0A9W9IIR4_9EURO|nr:uncharacterized protein N7482_002981 [Penicillium canariense]KAJ5177104.1 hypothetical protein N7482_002981 [Penicillium canariense]
MSDSTRRDEEPNGTSPATSSENSAMPEKEVWTSHRHRKLPGWLDHFNVPDLKILLRCTVAAWVASLLILINPSLSTIGTATFFATLVLFTVPPSGIVFIFILAMLTLIIGMAVGWAWGVIAMKAALAARPAAETQARLQALGQQAYSIANSTGQPITLVERELIFNGFMLDARVTAVYFCLICTMIYLLARLRAKNFKFILFQIFGTIIMDLFLTVGPLLPSFDGTLPKVLIEPAAIGIGIGLACNILFFPRSTSHTVLEGLEGAVLLLKGPLDATVANLIEGEALDLKDLQKLKMKILAAYKKIEPALAFLPLDFSVSRWNADDVKSLKEPIRQASLSTLSLLEFHIGRVGGEEKLEKLRAITATHNQYSEAEIQERKKGNKQREAGMRQLLDSLSLMKAFNTPEHEALRQEMLEAIRQPCSKILPACQEASMVVADCIHAVNSSRWFGQPSKERLNELCKRSETSLEALRSLRASFASETTERLIQTNADIFDESGKLKSIDEPTMHKVRGIAIGMVFEEQILGIADSWGKVLDQLVALMKERKTVRLWCPKGMRYAFDWVFHRTAVAPVQTAQSPVADPDEVEEQSKAAEQSLNMNRGYKVKRRSGLGRVLLGTYHWFICAEGMYALRMVVVSVALGIPAVIPSSAGFFYREKGLWALIMGQTGVVVYMSDFVLSFTTRGLGTVVGGTMALVAWYIGSGNGTGNPYGLAAILALVLLLLMWARIFAPRALMQGTMMGGATCILVIGYSYNDTHIPTYGNPGWGYNVYWRRLALVLVGYAATLIVQIIPRPPSAARHVCKSLSNTLRALADHYALLLSCWNQPDRDEGLMAEQLALDLADALSALDGPVALLRLEFSSSPFDSDTLGQVKSLCHGMNQHLARLLFLSASLPEQFQDSLARRTGLLDHRSIGDVMAVLGILEQALKTGDPLPEVLPTPLLKRCYEYWQVHQVQIELSTDLIRDENYRRFCVALTAYLKFLGTVDDLVLVMKGALGESHIVTRELRPDLTV